METALTVYIDEAGDPGIRDGLSYAEGRHEWLCVGAYVVRSAREAEVVQWVRELRDEACSRQSGALHFARITRERRAGVCQLMSTKPARAFCVASHKSNMREHINPKLGKMNRADQFYNWCMRLLFERVTTWASAWHEAEHIQRAPLQVTFAERGGHDYDHMFAYFDRLRMQVEAGTLVLKSGGLEAPMLERQHWRIAPAHSLAGLQLADVVASAFYQAANAASPAWDIAPAKALTPIVAADAAGVRANRGVTVWPLPHQAHVPIASRPIFEHFGYGFESRRAPASVAPIG